MWEAAFASLTTAEVVEEFHTRGGDAVPFTDYPSITAHPQVAAIGALVEVDQPGFGALRSVGPVWRFAATPAVVRCGAPALGADTDAVIADLSR